MDVLNIVVTARKQLPKRLLPHADKVALMMFDAWCEDDEDCMRVSGYVVEALGKRVAMREFDGGVAGSGQVVEAWSLQGRIFHTGEGGVYGVE